MKFVPNEIPEVIVIEPDVYRDARGVFLETYHAEKYRAKGITPPFVQDNHSRSVQGTLRGLHAQVRRPQGKLIRVVEGEIFDLALDIRRGSASFARWVGTTLSAESFRQSYIPPGFAHGFSVLSPFAQVEYKCTVLYDPEDELSMRWNDADLHISRPVASPLLSEKDRHAPLLRDLMDRLPTFVESGP